MGIRLPGFEDLGGRGSLRSGRAIASVDTTAIGEGVAAFGAGLSNLGAGLEKAKEAEGDLDVLRARSEYQKGRYEIQDAFQRDQDWRTYGERFQKASKDLRQRAASLIRDPERREEFRVSIIDDEAHDRSRLLDRAAALEKDEGRANLTGLLEQNRELALNESATEETRVGLIRSTGEAIDAAERAGYISEQEAQKLRTAWPHEYSRIRLKRDIQRDPKGTGLRLTGGSLVDRIIHAESGGNPNADNPLSSAGGLGQFIDSTWLSVVKKHRPDLAKGKTDAEILALKTDAKLSREMTGAYAQDNAAILKAKGLPVTDGNVYLMHHFGAGGGPVLIGADPTKAAAEVLPAAVMNANPVLKGKTVAEVKAWAAKRVGAGGSDAYPYLTEEDRIDAMASIEAEQRRRDAAARADARAAALALTQERTARKDSYTLAIEQRTLTDPNQFLADEILDDGDKAALLERFKSEFKTDIASTAALQAVATAKPGDFNRFDSDDRKTVETAYEAAGGAEGLLDGDQAAVQRLGAITAQTNIVPETAVETLRNGLISPKPVVVERSLSVARALIERDPNAFEGASGSKDVVDATRRFQHLTREQGVSERDAAAMVRETVSPSDPARRATLQKAVKAVIKETLGKTDEDVADVALEATGFAAEGGGALGWFYTDPTAGSTAGQQSQIAADFREFFEARFLESGDPADAKRMAAEDMKRIYGLTRVSGQPVLMKYAPELAYPPVAGSHEYLGKQLLAEVREVLEDPEVQAEDIALGWTTRTAHQFDAWRERGARIARGHPRDRHLTTRGLEPEYQVVVRREIDGQEVVVPLPGVHFRFEAAKAKKAKDAADRAVFEEQRAEDAEERARRERLENNPLTSAVRGILRPEVSDEEAAALEQLPPPVGIPDDDAPRPGIPLPGGR